MGSRNRKKTSVKLEERSVEPGNTSPKFEERLVKPGKTSVKFEERPVESREQDYFHYFITPYYLCALCGKKIF